MLSSKYKKSLIKCKNYFWIFQANVDLEFGAFDVPTSAEREVFQRNLQNSANMIFHAKTGLPLQSSPVCLSSGANNNFYQTKTKKLKD